VSRQLAGTRYGIRVDPADGLLAQGDKDYPLTWMDAKMPDWIVTPRRGKAVEINALWYNALKLLEGWVREEEGEDAARFYGDAAARAKESFNARFWSPELGFLRDVVDGEPADAGRLRPNQILSFSLPHPVLEPSRWEPVLEAVRRELLTPYGLRSLARGDAEFRARYDGDLKARDGAYHQGTVWSWLIGPYVDAWLKVHPGDRAGARRLLEAFPAHLGDACLGSVSEIFDAEAPYAPRGCVAQAWGVAEVLRVWLKSQEPE
jgi:predicted glycogen debranching enzyme